VQLRNTNLSRLCTPLLQQHVSGLISSYGEFDGPQLRQVASCMKNLETMWIHVEASAEPPLLFPPRLKSLTLNWTRGASPAAFTEAFNAAMQGIAQLTRLHELNITVWKNIWTAHCSFDRLRGMPSLSSFGIMAFYSAMHQDGVAEEFLTAEHITQLRKLTPLKRFAVTPLSAALRQCLLVKPGAPGWG
jgi:hypothetical protein